MVWEVARALTIEAEREVLAREILDLFVDLATHDFLIGRIKEAVDKGGIDAVERLLMDLEASRS